MTFFESNRILDASSTIVDQFSLLEKMLIDKQISYRINIVLLMDDDVIFENLTRVEAESYLDGREKILAQVKEQKPDWQTINLLPLPDGTFRDIAHFDSRGQDQIAAVLNYYSKVRKKIAKSLVY